MPDSPSESRTTPSLDSRLGCFITIRDVANAFGAFARLRPQPSVAVFCVAAFCFGAIAFGTGAAGAESKLLFEPPADLSPVSATTFDQDGLKVGESSFEVDISDVGTYHMKIELAVSDGGVNRSEAMLEAIPGVLGAKSDDGKSKLRLIEQRTRATRSDGVALNLLVIDHVKGRASCYATSDDEPGSDANHVDLPRDDRTVNVPLQLLFRPLARKEVDETRFQLAMCRSGPVIHDMIAVRGPRSKQQGRDVVEIRYGPDLGSAVAFFASRLLPRFSFWFDARTGEYVGHRMPLHRKGPVVLLVRQGFEPPDLGFALR